MKKIKSIYFLTGLILLTFFSCGYKFANNESLPRGIKSVNFLMFENKTATSGIESVFTTAFIYEFSKNKVVIEKNKSESDAVFKGVVNSVSASTVSHLDSNTANEAKVTISINILLTDKNGETVKRIEEINDSEDYAVSSGSKASTEKAKQDAIINLSKKLAEKTFLMLTEDF